MADPYNSSVVLLLRGEGANGSQNTYSETDPGTFLTAASNAQISTAQYKFGSSSLLFDGTGDYFSTPDKAGFDFGTGDFTVETWFYPTTAKACTIYEHANSPASGVAGLFLQLNADRTVSAGQAFGSTIVTSTTTLALNTWHFVTVQRASGAWTLYLNGTSAATATNSVSLTATGPVTIGGHARSTSATVAGNIDELRVTSGVARYSADFTPPTAAFDYAVVGGGNARLSTYADEVLYTAQAPQARVSTLANEVLYAGTPNARLSTLAVEVLRATADGPSSAMVTTFAVEVLRSVTDFSRRRQLIMN